MHRVRCSLSTASRRHTIFTFHGIPPSHPNHDASIRAVEQNASIVSRRGVHSHPLPPPRPCFLVWRRRTTLKLPDGRGPVLGYCAGAADMGQHHYRGGGQRGWCLGGLSSAILSSRWMYKSTMYVWTNCVHNPQDQEASNSYRAGWGVTR
jgi:hypothetical protein